MNKVYRFDDASAAIYSFVYDKFCSWYIELSKNILYGEDEKAKIIRATMLKYCFRRIVTLLHPIIPFITEEIWSKLETDRSKLLAFQEYVEFDPALENDKGGELMNKFIDITTGVINIRSSVNMKPKDEIDVKLFTDYKKLAKFVFDTRHFFENLANDRPKKSASLATTHTEIFIPLEGLIDINEQVNRIKNEMEKTQNEYKKVESKLNNQNFMNNAPEEVRAEVQEKARMFQEKLQSMQQILESFM